jgi:hypothetical protein
MGMKKNLYGSSASRIELSWQRCFFPPLEADITDFSPSFH